MGEMNGLRNGCGEIEKLVDGCFSGKCYVLDGRVEGYWLGEWESVENGMVVERMDLAIWWGITERVNEWKNGGI